MARKLDQTSAQHCWRRVSTHIHGSGGGIDWTLGRNHKCVPFSISWHHKCSFSLGTGINSPKEAFVTHGIKLPLHSRYECYSWYGLPPYAYLIRQTGTFIFLNSNLATPLFSNGTPLFHIRYKRFCFYLRLTFIPIYMTPSLYLHTTRLCPLIRTSIVLCSISTRLYLLVEP